METKTKTDEVLSRLMRIFREYSKVRRVYPYSQMCEFWEDPTVEILIGSDELNALELEFGIEFDDEAAMEIYDMILEEAAKYISKMVKEQNHEKHNSETVIDDLVPEKAKRILHEIWKDSFKGRNYITAAIDKIDFEDSNKIK